MLISKIVIKNDDYERYDKCRKTGKQCVEMPKPSPVDKHLFKLTESDNKEDVRMLPEFTCRYDQYIRYLNGHLEMLYSEKSDFHHQFRGESDTDISGNIHVNYGLVNLFSDENDNVSGDLDALLNFLHDKVLTTKDANGPKPNYHDNVEREIILSNMLFVVPEMMLGMQVKEKREKTENTYKYHPNFILPVLFKAVTAYTKKSVKQLVALDDEREVQRLGEDDPKGMSYNELRRPNWFHRMFAQKPNLLNYQIKGFRESVADQLRHTFALLLNIGYLSIQHLVDENFTMGNHGKTEDDFNPMKDTLSYPVFAGRNTFPWYNWYGFLDSKDLKKTLMVVQKKEKRGSKDHRKDYAFVDLTKNAGPDVIERFMAKANAQADTQTIQEYLNSPAVTAKSNNAKCFRDLSGTPLSAATFDEVEVVEPVIWARQYMQRVNKERRKVLYDQIFANFRMNQPAVRNFVETFRYVVECLDDTDKCSLILDMIKDLPASEPDGYCSDTDNPKERQAEAIKEIDGYKEFETAMMTHSSGGVVWKKTTRENSLGNDIDKTSGDGYKDLVGAIKTEITLGDNGSKYKNDYGEPVDKFLLSKDEVEKFNISDVKKGYFIKISRSGGKDDVYYVADPTRSGSFIESALSDPDKRDTIATFFESVVESTSQTDLMSSDKDIGSPAAGGKQRAQFEPSLEGGKNLTGAWNEYVSRLYKSVVEIGIKEFMLELANQLLENRTDPLVGDVSSFSRTARSSYELKSSLDLGDFYY